MIYRVLNKKRLESVTIEGWNWSIYIETKKQFIWSIVTSNGFPLFTEQMKIIFLAFLFSSYDTGTRDSLNTLIIYFRNEIFTLTSFFKYGKWNIN